MKVIIAEKPRMAKAIANALNVPKSSGRGVYKNAEFSVVSCQGHLITEYEPHDYNPNLKKWSLESLPIKPQEWKVKPIDGMQSMLSTIKNALEGADVVYAAGDPDAAGQRIVDEVLNYVGWKGEVLRPLISDLNPEPIQKAIKSAESNDLEKYRGLYRKEVSRARGDWLIGMNLTRLYTMLGEKLGLDTILSAGRVQSAALGLVVKRDIEILNFKPHDYFSIKASIDHGGDVFRCTWAPGENQEGLDEQGRLVSPKVADQLSSSAPCAAKVVSFEEKSGKERPPLTYSMSELQKHASKQYGMTMKQVLDTTQALYDTHELVTYPRSDTGHLPESQHSEAPVVMAAIVGNIPQASDILNACDSSLQSRAFNSKKVTAHHAIIPTQKNVGDVRSKLSDAEYQIYELVCLRYMMQFMSDAEYATRSVVVRSDGGEMFKASSKVYISQGWRALHVADSESDDEEANIPAIPKLEEGVAVSITEIRSEEKTTQPPKHYTDSSLLDAMTNIHRHVSDKEVAKHLKEGEGIGTEATRADIIEKLVSHELIYREAKKIKSTKAGRFHCSLMPADLTTPDMAGLFEYSTKQVQGGELSQNDFLDFIGSFITHQIDNAEAWVEKAKGIGVDSSMPKCRACENPMKLRKTKKDKRKIWVCSACDSIYMDEAGAPGICVKGELKESDQQEKEARLQERMKDAPPCPRCQSPILKEKSKSKKIYWRCRGCNSCFFDYAGEIGPAYVVEGERQEIKPDGPECTQCGATMFRRLTKKKKPMFACNECDSMAWSDNGEIGQYFKIRGEMQNSKAKKPEEGEK